MSSPQPLQQYTQLDLLRHGSLVTPKLFCAKAHEPLSEQGFASLKKATENKHWDIIISSSHQRCLEFATQLSKEKVIPLEVSPLFTEMDFGDWSGIRTDELWQQYSEEIKQLWASPETFISPNGEAMTDFIARVESGLDTVLQAYPNRSILLITHAGVIRAILAKALGVDHIATQRFIIDYASMTRLRHYCGNSKKESSEFALHSHGVAIDD